MTNGALPSRNRVGGKKLLCYTAIVAASAFGWWGCSDVRSPLAPSTGGFHLQADNGDDNDEDENRKPTANGAGRVDFFPGGPTKNPPPYYQEFGFQFRITAHNNSKGHLQLIDHRPQLDGKPLRLKLVSVTSVTFTPADGLCLKPYALITGIVRVKNDNLNHTFRLRVCDQVDPGNKAPWDKFDFTLNGWVDPQLGMEYHLYKFPDPAEGAYLTGGNIKVRKV